MFEVRVKCFRTQRVEREPEIIKLFVARLAEMIYCELV